MKNDHISVPTSERQHFLQKPPNKTFEVGFDLELREFHVSDIRTTILCIIFAHLIRCSYYGCAAGQVRKHSAKTFKINSKSSRGRERRCRSRDPDIDEAPEQTIPIVPIVTWMAQCSG